MEQDGISISWEGLPWKKFQKKSSNLQCKIYKAKQSNNFRLVRRFQKLLISSKSVYYLAVRDLTQNTITKGLFLSESEKFSLVNQAQVMNRKGNFKIRTYFSESMNFRESFNLSFLRNKVIESVWKSIIEPTCIKKFINLDKKWTKSYKNNTTKTIKLVSKDQTLLKITLNLNLVDLKLNTLMSRIWLPLKHKVMICKAIKKSNLKFTGCKDGLISLFCTLLWEGIENLNSIFLCKNIKMIHSYKFAFCQDNEIFYFLRKGQDKIHLYNEIQKFLEGRGMSVKPSTIQFRDVDATFDFPQQNLSHTRKREILPSFTYWSNYKKYLIYTLKKEHISGSIKIKKIKCMLLTWSQHANLYSKTKLKSSFFYLKKLLARST